MDKILDWRSPNFLYQPQGTKNLKLFLKNYRLSDDIGFRFSDKMWSEYPLTADKFANWVAEANATGDIINLFMDYETFGEHQWAETGIFDFLRHLPATILQNPENSFVLPSEAIAKFPTMDKLDIPEFISWADTERDLSAWRSNAMQIDALAKIYSLEADIKSLNDPQILDDWQKLQTSDHFYYMCTKYFSDGDIHKYFSPYDTPYEAFIYYMNALKDLSFRVQLAKIMHKREQKEKV